MNLRTYDPAKDLKSVCRILQETRWIKSDDEDQARYLEILLSNSSTLVADIEGEAESIAASVSGSILHLRSEISMSAITMVATSLIARKRGFASALTAQSVADQAEAGMEASALGMFDQGYYGRLGFGTGPYEHQVRFDPSHLEISLRAKTPIRLQPDCFAEVHHALSNRWRAHGGVLLHPPEFVHSEMGLTEDGIGFGYRDHAGNLSHFIWGELADENGPYKIDAVAYQTKEQLLELLALLKGMADQLHSVRITEPAHLQMQDLIREPFRRQNTTRGSQLSEFNAAEAYWQIRINDLESCIAKTHLPARPTLSFNLTLSDPITKCLPEARGWNGIGGEYTIHLGEESAAKPGHQSGLPLLESSTSGFSRLWLGCASASAISVAGELTGPPELLGALEQTLSLPLPKLGWEF